MNPFDRELNQRLASLRQQGLYRCLRRIDSPQSACIHLDGKTLLNFSSNDYLGLANEPLLREAAVRAVDHYGAGAGASRLICGSLAPHAELDGIIAAFKGTEAALSFATGYAAALGAVGALVGKGDVVVLDKLVHASIVDAARLCGAKLRVFAHNDLDQLEHILAWATRGAGSANPAASGPRSRTLIVTESVFSMEGDHAPLREIVRLKDQYGAWLMVDEAHATGLYGRQGRGLADALGVASQVEIQMGTLGKAIGASGGYICGSRALIDLLVNRARSFLFSTAPVPAAAAAAAAGVRFVESDAGEDRRRRLWALVAELRSGLVPRQPASACPAAGPNGASTRPSAIIPIWIGDETAAVTAANTLRDQGIFIPAIRFPTVQRGSARLRLTLSANHTSADLARLLAVLKSANLSPLPPPSD